MIRKSNVLDRRRHPTLSKRDIKYEAALVRIVDPSDQVRHCSMYMGLVKHYDVARGIYNVTE